MYGWAYYALHLDGSLSHLSIAEDRVMAFDILLVGSNSAGYSVAFKVVGLIENIGGTTSFVGTPTVTLLGTDSATYDAYVEADDTIDALRVWIRGGAASDTWNMRWVATVRTAEVGW
jgi:hypothetical protein